MIWFSELLIYFTIPHGHSPLSVWVFRFKLRSIYLLLCNSFSFEFKPFIMHDFDHFISENAETDEFIMKSITMRSSYAAIFLSPLLCRLAASIWFRYPTFCTKHIEICAFNNLKWTYGCHEPLKDFFKCSTFSKHLTNRFIALWSSSNIMQPEMKSVFVVWEKGIIVGQEI